jgi:hypothetical protein
LRGLPPGKEQKAKRHKQTIRCKQQLNVTLSSPFCCEWNPNRYSDEQFRKRDASFRSTRAECLRLQASDLATPSTRSSSSARRMEPGATLSSDISDLLSNPTITGMAGSHEHQRIHPHSNNGRRRNWLGESSIRIRLDPLRVR